MQSQCAPIQINLKTIINIIIDTVVAEKIFLLPAQPLSAQTPVPQQLPAYHLLVLSRERGKYNAVELQQTIETQCAAIAIVNVIILDIYFFNEQLREQQYFFPELDKSSIVYDYGHVPLPARSPMDIAFVQRSLRQSFRLLFNKSELLFSEAHQQWKRGIMHLPYLSESTWSIFTALEIVYTGHDPQTRDIFRLRRSTARFSGDLALLFPCHSQKEKFLLTRLHKISINKPAKEKNGPSTLEYEAALRRVQDFQMVAIFTCQEYINKMDDSVLKKEFDCF